MTPKQPIVVLGSDILMVRDCYLHDIGLEIHAFANEMLINFTSVEVIDNL